MRIPGDHKAVAAELRSWIETAVSEMATAEHGSTLKAECEADANYNDAGLIHDLLADRIHDECYKDTAKALLVIHELSKNMAHLPESMWQRLTDRWVKKQGVA